MDIIYRAYDGKEFDDEGECFEYEQKKQLEEINITALTWDKEQIEDFYGYYDECYYLKLNTLENYQKVQSFFDNEGIERLPEPHSLNKDYSFFYNDKFHEWVDVYQRKLELKKELQDLEF